MTANTFTRIGIALLCALGSAPIAAADKIAPTTATSARLAVSLLDVMRASVQIPADGIWGAAGADKLSDDQWLLAEQDSINLVAAASLIATPGTGKNNRMWVQSPDWQNWVREYRSAALELRAAVRARDLAKLSAAGDGLTKVCEDCHTQYRPATPSDGVSRYPFYPKRDLPPQ
jgi:hypothetical protein